MLQELPEYRTRSLVPDGLRRIGDWTVKLYQIDAHGPTRPAAALTGALDAIPSLLPSSVEGGTHPVPTPERAPEGAAGSEVHGEAFAIVHAGADAVWLLVFWWTDACLLHRRILAAPLDRPGAFAAGVPETLVACSWELAVVQHERDAWVRWVQGRGPDADADAYHTDMLGPCPV